MIFDCELSKAELKSCGQSFVFRAITIAERELFFFENSRIFIDRAKYAFSGVCFTKFIFRTVYYDSFS